MKRTLLRIFPILMALVLLITVAGGSSSVSADRGENGPKGPKTKPPEVVERVVGKAPIFDENGRFLGIVTTVVGSITTETVQTTSGNLTGPTAQATYTTRSRTCYSKMWATHWTGWYKLWELKLSQTWGYNGSRIVWNYQPDVVAWSRFGWRHTEPRKGIYWTRYPMYKRTWTSAMFTYEPWKGYPIQSRYAAIAFNIKGDGRCFY